MHPVDRIAAACDVAIGIVSHLNGPSCGHRQYRVAVAIQADEAGAGDGMLALMEAVERCQDRLQGRSLHIQRLGDGNIPAFGMGMMLGPAPRSEAHTSELQSLMRIPYAVFCLKQ